MKSSWITITEAAARMGIQTRRVRYLLEKGELEDNGLQGKKRRVKWQTTEEADQEEGETLEEAKRRKTIAEANLIEQKSMDFQKGLFFEWSDKFFNAFTESFSLLHNKLTQKRLNANLTKEINESFTECLEDLQSRLESISPGKSS